MWRTQPIVCTVLSLLLIIPVAAFAAPAEDAPTAGEDPSWPSPPQIVPVKDAGADAEWDLDDAVHVSNAGPILGIGTLGLWGFGPDVDRTYPTSTVLFSITYSTSNDDWFIFWMYDAVTLTYVLCDNHPFVSFADLPDGHRSISIGTIPITGVQEPLASGLYQGYGVSCSHVDDVVPGAFNTYRVTTPGLCHDGTCTPVDPGLAGEFSLLPV